MDAPPSPVIERDRVKLEILAPFYRKFATLLSSGVNIACALETLAKSEEETLGEVLEGLHTSIIHGESLSQAMTQHPQVFGSFAKGLIHAGECSGRLAQMADRLADTSERSLRLKRMVVSSLAYPAILSLTTLGLTVLLGTIICSQDDALFAVGGELPGVTQLIVAVSRLLSDPVFLIVCPITTILLLAYFRQQFSANSKLGHWFDRMQLRLPFVGSIVRNLNNARFTYVLGLCLEVGIGLVPGIKLIEELTPNRYVSSELKDLRNDICQGVGLAESMRNQDLFDPLLITMTELGEHTGTLAELLLTMSNSLEEELQDALLAFAKAIEPVMLIGSGVIVMVVSYGMLAPTLTLLQEL